MFSKLKSPILLLLLFALLIRLFVMQWSFNFRENTDVLRWRDWGRIAYLHSLTDTYNSDYITFGTFANNKPPGEIYVVSLMYNINIFMSKVILKISNSTEGSIQWVNVALLNANLRIPSIIADLTIAGLIYILVNAKTDRKKALFASSLFALNPVVIFNSSFWGQMDAINNLFLFFCLFFLYKKQFFLGILTYFLSLFMKLSLIPMLPFFLLYLYKIYKLPLKKIVLFMCLTSIILLVATIPISHEPVKWYFEFFQRNSLGEMQNITAFAFNFWWFIFMPKITLGKESNLFEYSEIRLSGSPLDNTLFAGVPLFYWAIGVFIFFLIPIFFFCIKLKEKIKKPENIFLIFSLVSLCMYLFLPRMHERYMYPLFPLLATYIGLKNRYLNTFIIFSGLNLINLLITWHPMRVPIPYFLMDSIHFQWIISLITVIIFLIFYTTSLKTLLGYEKNK